MQTAPCAVPLSEPRRGSRPPVPRAPGGAKRRLCSVVRADPVGLRIADPPPVSRLRTLRVAAGDIKLAHSVFALPFAILGALLARPEGTPGARHALQLVLVVACMIAARSWAMLANRLFDRAYDAANPRTARRAIPRGTLAPRAAAAIMAGAGAAFVTLCALFWLLLANPWPLALSVPVLAWLAFYSVTKRFTALCHLVLGLSLAASPLAAAIAVDPGALRDTPALWWLAAMVALWVGGFDVLYALQDLDFDRRTGLRSIPAALGPSGALWVSRAMHGAAVASLVLARRADPRLAGWFTLGIAVVAVLLVVEHVVVARRPRHDLEPSWFTLNGAISCVLGALGAVDLTTSWGG